MKVLTTSVALLALALPAFADGDAAKGEKEFKKCKSCHEIASADEVIVKGGKTGPDLYGVIGRQAGSVEGFKYGASIVEAGEGGLIWTEEDVAEYVKDPKAFLSDKMGHAATSNMSFKLRKGGEDVAAYLATFSDPAEEDETKKSDS